MAERKTKSTAALAAQEENATEETVIEQPAEVSDTAEAVKEPLTTEEYYNQPVTVKLFKDSNKYKDDVFVAVNGVGMIVPRGVEVQIPRKYAEVLHNSEQQSSFAVEFSEKLSGMADSQELN